MCRGSARGRSYIPPAVAMVQRARAGAAVSAATAPWAILQSSMNRLAANLASLEASAALQAFMSRDCPLAQPQLALVLRILFFSGTWSYFAAAVCMPVFILMPFIAIAFRIYPAVLSQSLLCAFVPYFIATHAGSSRCLH